MIEVNGVRLAYDEAGVGPAVVLSHAGLADRRMWEHQFEQLSADHRVIRYDWRGYGGSDDAAGSFAHYRDLLGLLDALEIDTAALVGCSMGGAYSVDVALAAPERVRALVLICSGLSGHQWPEEMLVQVRARVHSSVPADRLADYRLRPATRVREDDVAAMAEAQARFLVAGPERDPGEVDPAVWQSAVTMLKDVFDRQWRGPASTESHLDPPAVDRLSEIGVPTLVINGLDDARWIQQVSDLLCVGIADARRLDLPRTGHLPPLERSEQVTDALRAFLTTG